MNAIFKSLLSGVATFLIVQPTAYTLSLPKQRSDFESMSEDWQRVGQDIRNSMNEVAHDVIETASKQKTI